MSPPIRDGSGSSIGSIRLGDGSEISEVRTGAGDVLFSAIPDSVVSRYDATEESSTGSISSITDQLGFADLSGSCTVESSVIDGKQAFRFQNSKMNHTTTISTSDPIATVAVVKFNQIDQNVPVFDGGNRQEFQFFDNGDSRWAVFRGGSFTNFSANKDTNAHLITIEGTNSTDITLEIDDNVFGTTSNSEGDFTGLTLGGGDSGSTHPDVYFGQVETVKGHTSSELQSIQDRLKTKWNTP